MVHRPSWIVQIIVRTVLGMAMIFFINQFLASKGITAHVGMNLITCAVSGMLGVPGVALLYGVAFYSGI